MKNLILTILISLLCINCEQGAETGSTRTDPSIGGTLPQNKQRYLIQNYSDLGAVGKLAIDLDSQLAYEYTNKYYANGDDWFHDDNVVTAIRGFVNAYVKSDLSNGSYDMMAVTPEVGFDAIVTNEGPTSPGLNKQQICVLLADVYEAFGLESRVIFMASGATTHSPEGIHCLTEVNILGDWQAHDPVFNVSYILGSPEQTLIDSVGETTHLSAAEIAMLAPSALSYPQDVFMANPDGRANHPDQLNALVSYQTYYHHDSFLTGSLTNSLYPGETDILINNFSGSFVTWTYSSLGNR